MLQLQILMTNVLILMMKVKECEYQSIMAVHHDTALLPHL